MKRTEMIEKLVGALPTLTSFEDDDWITAVNILDFLETNGMSAPIAKFKFDKHTSELRKEWESE